MSDRSPSSSNTDTSGGTIASLGSADFFLPSDIETEGETVRSSSPWSPGSETDAEGDTDLEFTEDHSADVEEYAPSSPSPPTKQKTPGVPRAAPPRASSRVRNRAQAAIEVVVPSRRYPSPPTVQPETSPIKLLEAMRAFGLLQVEPIDGLFVITQQAEYFTQTASRGNDPGLAAMVQDALDIVCKRPVRTAAVRAYRRALGSHIHAFYKAVIKASRAAERIKLTLHALIVGPPPATLLL
ncbi:hypothetical protein OC846_004198 [Tilletia horrida]|uniref:Uncharacterized protein n=1 Tax=Tilletia horrida TaxID=155126 RepID=A0AAN6JR25_9BASI|nr:hypothetical protein OC846_004198 [Tilletia horrida]KAK0564504.1 hypothetical protein OC861_004248 [Tilletia horrida]